ncbi:peptidase S10 serine carboxypeptidase [Rhodopirellula europaea 6C]|uniref:Peptidase S10 serine carboxypeptidase n=2 Tax=Rhodopirellula TaxID=265488 RepID=M2B9R0_9BACT|nr:peptidase S10 serine carboxypeptidase [Rhodopirellula europaea 6C]
MDPMNWKCFASLLVLFFLSTQVNADDTSASKDKAAAEKTNDELTDKFVSTEHSFSVAGETIDYTATAGRLVMQTDDLDPKAEVFFVSYTRKTDDVTKRPITFCFNGGPGSSSVWLHLGMLGPKIIRFPDDASFLRPPYHLDENHQSLLDITDLVFIDPVSTGYSRPAKDVNKSEFHGYNEDVRSVGQFIHDYTTIFERWLSPKVILGESYGGLRVAGLSGYLRDHYKMELNGAVVISGAINFQTLRFSPSNDVPDVCFLPTYTATAYYHKQLDDELQSLPLAEVVAQSEKFAYRQYAPALLKGTSIGKKERQRVAKELARLTGLSEDYLLSSNLKLSMQRFGKELLRDEGLTVGRFDGRYTSIDRDSAGETPEFDASGAAIFGPFTACLNDYMHRELNYKDRRVYEILTGNVHPWSYKPFEGRYVDASETLRGAMAANPSLKLFVACGYFDLATPHFAMEYTIDHMGLSPERSKNLTIKHYEGGHMMYIHEPSLKQLRKDLVEFYDDAVGHATN